MALWLTVDAKECTAYRTNPRIHGLLALGEGLPVPFIHWPLICDLPHFLYQLRVKFCYGFAIGFNLL